MEDFTESFEPITGTSVTLRPLRRDDSDIEHAFVSGLSPDTRYNRLLGGSETLIGVARYVLDKDDQAAEFAVVIADSWHGRGIGSRLLAKLSDAARRRGVKRLYGDILAINRPMLGLVQKLGFRLSRHEDPTLTRATLAL